MSSVMNRRAYVAVRSYLRDELEMRHEATRELIARDEVERMAVDWLSTRFPRSAQHREGIDDLVGAVMYWQEWYLPLGFADRVGVAAMNKRRRPPQQK